MPRRRRQQRGKGLKDVLNKLHSIIKENKLISRGANALAPILPGQFGHYAGRIGSTAAALGYGRRRYRRRRY